MVQPTKPPFGVPLNVFTRGEGKTDRVKLGTRLRPNRPARAIRTIGRPRRTRPPERDVDCHVMAGILYDGVNAGTDPRTHRQHRIETTSPPHISIKQNEFV